MDVEEEIGRFVSNPDLASLGALREMNFLSAARKEKRFHAKAQGSQRRCWGGDESDEGKGEPGRRWALLQGDLSISFRTRMRDWFRNREGMTVNENQIGRIVVDAAVAVHRGLGPGLLESVYEVVLAQELQKRGLKVRRQVPVAITYEGITFDEGFRADLVIEDCVLAELKSVEKSSPVHAKQVLTYLRLTDMKLGFLLNFGEALMKDGINRIVNGLDNQAS